MKFINAICLSLVSLTAAAPAPQPAAAPQPANLEERQLGGLLNGLLGGVFSGINSAAKKGDVNGVLSQLKAATPTATPASPSAAIAAIQNIQQTAKPTNIYQYSAALSANGLLSGTLTSLINGIGGQFTGQNSISNSNPDPPTPVYPKRASCDAPYTVSEASLRGAIYIPPTFTKGQKPPVILFPGTGNTGFQTFAGNFIKQLTNVPWADPVWVNVPNQLVDDAQKNAQYAAYALNYIASLTGKNVTIVAWSQGNIDTQWAFKYFPSTRKTTSDHLALSADYKGTVLADFSCPDGLSCTPAVYQQQYLSASNFITALRSNGGDSAYVPVTSVYSGLLDEVVEPQQGTGASAYINDARGVGVTNVEVQTACPGQPGGSFYGHEGILYNPLSIALLKDAMSNPGPGSLSRIDAKGLCASYLGAGLGLGDLLVTENSIAIAGLAILVGNPRVTAEPAVMAYANAAPATC